MTTPNQAAEAICARFEANIGSGVAFTYENEDLKEPDTWLRLSIRTRSRAQETLGKPGNRKYWSGAAILVECYTRTDLGRQPADTLARAVANIFEGESFSGVYCNNSVARERPPDGKWFSILVEINFNYEETK